MNIEGKRNVHGRLHVTVDTFLEVSIDLERALMEPHKDGMISIPYRLAYDIRTVLWDARHMMAENAALAWEVPDERLSSAIRQYESQIATWEVPPQGVFYHLSWLRELAKRRAEDRTDSSGEIG